MRAVIRSLVMVVTVALLSAGCAQDGGSGVAVLDLSAIAKATGQDEVIRVKAEASRNELVAQLQQLALNLDQQLAAEAEKVGDKPTPEQEQRLQQLNAQARGQLAEVQQQAQAQANQIEESLITEFTDAITPLAAEIAKGRGAKLIVAQDTTVFWYDPSVDITDEVIAAWRARPAEEAAEEVSAVEESVEEVAEAQAELDEVTEELAEAEEELAEAEQQIEVLEEVIEDTLNEEAPAAE